MQRPSVQVGVVNSAILLLLSRFLCSLIFGSTGSKDAKVVLSCRGRRKNECYDLRTSGLRAGFVW